MDFLKQGFNVVLGQPTEMQTGAETVERLVDRLESATLLEDRRDTVRSLRALSKEYQLEVGTRGMNTLLQVLQNDCSDVDTVRYCLETLVNLMSTENPAQSQIPVESQLGVQFTEIFVKNSDNVSLLLNMLEEFDFYVRFPCIQLLTLLSTNRPSKLQECILASPLGVVRLMDLLSDTREIIRNEGLLLLIQLTASNPSIQKIVTFENAFERLTSIILEEGLSDGGIIVQDCLHMMHNLLRNNVSNQNYFRETSCIPKIAQFYFLDQNTANFDWTDQKITNMLLMLELLRLLVSANNPSNHVNQNIVFQNGIVKMLISIGLSDNIPLPVKCQTLDTLAEVVRGLKACQDYLVTSLVSLDGQNSHSFVVCLLFLLFDARRSFDQRYSALYCFQSYLCKNESAQQNLLLALASAQDSQDEHSMGFLLSTALFNPNDPVSNWFSALVLTSALHDNCALKESALKIRLLHRLGDPPTLLLVLCAQALLHGTPKKPRSRIGLYVLLSVWLFQCPAAVDLFVQVAGIVSFLVEQIEHHSTVGNHLPLQGLAAFLLGICVEFNGIQENAEFHRKSLIHIISHRIGNDRFSESLNHLYNSQAFVVASKARDSALVNVDEIYFDPDFIAFVRGNYQTIRSVAISTNNSSQSNQSSEKYSTKKSANNPENHESVVKSYQEIIRNQDLQLEELRKQLAAFHQQKQQQQQQQDLATSNQLDENEPQNGAGFSSLPIETILSENQTLKASLQDSHQRLIQYEQEQYQQNCHLQNASQSFQELQAYHEKVVAEKDLQILQLESQISNENFNINSTAERNDFQPQQDLESHPLQAKIKQLQEELDSLRLENLNLQEASSVTAQNSSPSSSDHRIREEEWKRLEEKLHQKEEAYLILEKEQEDLLVCLAEQDLELKELKRRLKNLGEEVDEEDFDEDNEN